MKRYCQILVLPDDEQAIATYDEVHSRVARLAAVLQIAACQVGRPV